MSSVNSDSIIKIGVFDSGCGGISFLNEAVKVLPNSHFIYLADFKNAPYGTKTQEEILSYTLSCGRQLFEYGVGAIVMACNTATSLGVKSLRSELNIPVVSMEPAIKPALEYTSGDVLCLSTNATAKQERYLSLLSRLDIDNRVLSLGASELVEIVNSGEPNYEKVRKVLDGMPEISAIKNLTAVVLGCTHFVFLKEHISRYFMDVFGTAPILYDGNAGTARQLKNVLIERNLDFSFEKLQVKLKSTDGKIEILEKYLNI